VRGIERYKTKSGFTALRIHYTADPEKDPSTPAGKVWVENELKGYLGGMSSSSWQQEMEVDWSASGGELVFPLFDIFRHKIVVAPYNIPETWALYGTFDYGHRNPSAFHVHAIDHDGNVHTVWELYEAGLRVRQIARAIRGLESLRDDGSQIPRCPFFSRLSELPIADPSIKAKNQDSNQEMKSLAQLFAELPEEEQVIFQYGARGGDVTFAEKINSTFWNDLDKQNPRWTIFATCPMLIWELRKLRFADFSATAQETKNLQEKIVDKDNHGVDGCKYFFNRFFSTPDKPDTPKSYEYLKKIDYTSYKEAEYRDKMALPKDGSSGMGDW
jgi:hypothetical protein